AAAACGRLAAGVPKPHPLLLGGVRVVAYLVLGGHDLHQLFAAGEAGDHRAFGNAESALRGFVAVHDVAPFRPRRDKAEHRPALGVAPTDIRPLAPADLEELELGL